MLIGRPDLVFKEVTQPHNLWCSRGHKAPPVFSREGPGTPPQQIRFFQVSSEKDPNVNGTYCEPCLIIANAMAREMRIK